ncbi:hypothetical protein [Mycolicibacterium conceptionense]|uniref:hypothetical protein n=1 Tax=Mycolicibacterium conceptionense TaxID=451644 RepID=UPI001041DFF7|nr:hypothetical protein [Mycolicibacterium conceptionense]
MPTPTITDADGYYVHPAWAAPMERVLARLEDPTPRSMRRRGDHGLSITIDPGNYQGRHRAAEVAAA